MIMGELAPIKPINCCVHCEREMQLLAVSVRV